MALHDGSSKRNKVAGRWDLEHRSSRMPEEPRRTVAQVALLLIVDDDDELRAALASTLTEQGFRVAERASGEEALAYLHEGGRPDLILLDLLMPGMTGWELRSELLDDMVLASIPVVALSADHSAQARAIHAEAFLLKPVTSERLLATVQRALRTGLPKTSLPEQASSDRSGVLPVLRDAAVAEARAKAAGLADRQPMYGQDEAELACERQLALISSSVSHVVNNTLQGVLAFAELVPEARQADAVWKSGVLRSVHDASAILQKLASSASYSSHDVPLQDVTRMMEAHLAAWRALCPANIELRVDVPTTPMFGAVDPELFHLTTTELLKNAIEAIALADSLVQVRLAHCYLEQSDVSDARPARNARAGHWCCLDVVDTGPGIEPETLSHVFEPFYSTHFPGRGLGLSVVLAAMRSLGGLVQVRSQPGKGTRARLMWTTS